MRLHPSLALLAAASAAALLASCGGGNSPTSEITASTALPQLGAASGATLQSCTDLASKIAFANTTITAANAIADGVLTIAGTAVPAHCQLLGNMYARTSAVDGKNYAIGFEMRLPVSWNGRFFYQANGGIDGSVVTATGPVGGGGPLTNALSQGFAVISSDAGHVGSQGPFFGLDPQARLDYGYQAVGKLTPMAKAAIKAAYGKAPDRSYIGGCSNGGRHTMVAASRYADQYDGFLVGDPGFRLPLAAIANMAAAQAYATVATNPADPSTGYTVAEQKLVASAVLAKCDALDGVVDGIVQDTNACQAAFNISRDVPTCAGARDGTCLSAAQKTVIGKRFAGMTNSTGTKFYSSFPFDAGIGSGNTVFWNFTAPTALDSGAAAFIWQTPPEAQAGFNGANFALTTNIDTMLAKINATSTLYVENALAFMTPPNPSNLSTLKNRGAKIMVYHGTSDPIFSSDDTTNWYESVRAANAGDPYNFARFYRVPGMTHCSDGPTTDQFNMLTPLVNWVEKGYVPETVVAAARGVGNAGGANASLPANWSPARTRPLCSYPNVARYKGTGNIELAENFSCDSL